MRQLSLSTMWAVRRFASMAEFAARARSMGFGYLELAMELTPQHLSELEGVPGLAVSSLHNPCPMRRTEHGVPLGDLSLSAMEEGERTTAVNVARDTIDLAARLGARAVVLHMGSVIDARGFMPQLIHLASTGQREGREYTQLKAQAEEVRASYAERYVEAAQRSLAELQPYALDKGIMLGLETRFHMEEIPSLPEMERMLAGYGEVVGYWHDVGHAEVQARLGFAPHRRWLERLGSRMVGMHVHDVRGVLDHWAPGMGEVDWAMVAGLMPRDVLVVCEPDSSRNGEDEISKAPAFLEAVGIVD